MAIKVYNGTNWDDVIGSASIGGTNVSVTAAGITSLGNTAPNTTNQAVGVLLAIVSLPTTANLIVELLESGVVKATETVNLADLRPGFIYVRFATPYTFATTSAGAYTVRVKSSTGTQGVLRTITAGNLWNQIVYDSNTSLGATDDAWIGGYKQNSGITTKTLSLTGTSNSWGSGADTAMVYTTQWSMGASTTIFQGGSLVFDNTANCDLTQLGSIIVYKDGLFDMRPGSAYTNKLIFNQQSTDGRFGIMHPGNGLGGQVLTTGKTVTVARQYASGDGSTGSPLTFQAAHGLAVGDELVIPGLTFGGNQIRFVRTVVNTTQVTTAATLGGAESAFTNTPAVGSWISNLTRNSIIKNTGTSHGFWIMNADTNASPVSSYNYTRFEYPNCLSGKNLALSGSTLSIDGNDATIDGLVIYNNSAAARNTITYGGKVPQTISNVVLYNTKGSNYSAQSGLVLQNATGKVIEGLYHYAEPSSTTNCAALSFASTATSNIVRNLHSYGGNAQNGLLGYSLGIFGAGNTIEDSTINSSRVTAIRGEGALSASFNNCSFGTIGTNTIELTLASSTLNTMLFSNCNFGSATLVSNYLNTLDGTDIAIQDMDGNTSKHRWYTNYGSFWSSGAGLTETTTRTVGSLSLAIKPENSSTGASLTFKVPANPTSNVQIYGYIYRNSTFSSGDIVCELFLPGTLLTDTPDSTVTLSTTTLTWHLWKLNAYYSGSVARYATVRIRAKTATAGAYAFLDDIYDAALNNKVAGMDLWDEGHISPIMLALDLSALPEQTRVAVWSDNSIYDAGEKGTLLASAADDADTAANK